jgi:hypothetical protein
MRLKRLSLLFLLPCVTLLSGGCGGSNTATTVNRIQRGGAIQGGPLSLTNTVTTLAGTAGAGYGSADGIGAAARFANPTSITTDGTFLYVTDTNNNTIRKIKISTGTVTTLAGSAGSDGKPVDGIGSAARFDAPSGVTTDGTYLYVTDFRTIRKIEISTGTVTTLAGSADFSGSVDGIGVAARFDGPAGITTDGTNLYVTDFSDNTIRKIVISTGAVTTLAGTAGSEGSADGIGAAATFTDPLGITTDGTNLYVMDGSGTIRKIVVSTGAVTTLAGFLGENITTDGTNLYVSERRVVYSEPASRNATTPSDAGYYGDNIIYKIVLSTGAVTTLAGNGNFGAADGIGAAASFNSPNGITTDGTGLYLVDSGNNTIRKIH